MSFLALILPLLGSVLSGAPNAAAGPVRLTVSKQSSNHAVGTIGVTDDRWAVFGRAVAGGTDNVLFDPAAVKVYPGVSGEFEVWVSPTGLGAFQSADIVIGSDNPLSLQFSYAASWLADTLFTVTPNGIGYYPSDIYVGGFLETPVAGPVLIGTLTIPTQGLAFGDHTVMVDALGDFGFSAIVLYDGPDELKEFLSGSATMTFNEEPPCPIGIMVCTGPAECNDSIACTVDDCVDGCCTNTPNDQLCDNGAFCNGAETCNALTGCVPGTPPNCNDVVGCTIDSCDEINDMCVNTPSDALCTDGQSCNGMETCDPVNDCQAGTAPDCDDGLPCTIDACDEANDVCTHAPDNSACSDGDYCNGNETCVLNVGCQMGTPPNCNDGVICTVDSCDEVSDTCVHNPSDASCDDGAFCNGAETCDPLNGCAAGTPPNCNDGVGCTIDSCDEVNDVCIHTANNGACNDNQFCNGVELCDLINDCRPGTAPNCNDSVICTFDSCDEVDDTCVHNPFDAACADGQFCNGTETCDPINDCQPGTPPDCGDGVGCTIDTCNESTDSCEHAADDSACDDLEYCNGVESCDLLDDCQAGVAPNCNDGVACTVDTCDETNDKCVNQPSDAFCDDSQFCNGPETCDGVNGCEIGTPPNCGDDVPCTVDSCDESNDMCVNAPDDASCDDLQHCNGVETCDPINDCQSGPPPNCDDAVNCTVDSCDEEDDVCVNQPDDSSCSNGLFCDGTESCDPVNGCQGGTPPNCDDSVDCTDDACDEINDVCVNDFDNSNCDDGLYCNGMESCDPINGCQTGSEPCPPSLLCDEVNDVCVDCLINADCDDGQYCNGLETCDPVKGCRAGTAPDCDDGVSCTVDSCDELNDVCVNTASDSLCNDGLHCNGVETCDAIDNCRSGLAPICDDGVSCTIDSCDEVKDMCVNAPSDALCDDGQYCSGAETCDALNDCQPGTPPDCSDGVGCTSDSCDEVNDLCVNAPTNSMCDDAAFCNGVESCDALNDCQPGTPPDCGDSVGCTVDSCDEKNDLCVNEPDDAECDDGQFCNGGETCDPVLGCQVGAPPDCDDSVSCTIDKCNETDDLCTHTPNDGVCGNGLFCDGAEFCDPVDDCQNGLPPNCDDGVACTVDVCDEKIDMCVRTPNDALCDNDLFCDGVEACDQSKGCQIGTPPNCNDGVGCTVDTCDEVNDLCSNDPNDTLCDDTAFCNGLERCDSINDCQAGVAPDCSDDVGCTDDSCNEDSDTCENTPDDAACNDEQFCNGIETCDAALGCLVGSLPNCDDGVGCTIDTCNENTDQCDHAPDNAACSDGLFCNGLETCHPKDDCVVGPAPNCDDGIPCTVDSCDETNDTCQYVPDDAACDDGVFCNGQELCFDRQCVSGEPACDQGSGCCDEEQDICLLSELVSSFPLPDETLWRSQRNRMRLTFPSPDVVPTPERVQVRALLPNGQLGVDLGAGFDFTVQASTLTLVDAPPYSLENQTWYKVSWCNALDQGACCSVDFLVQAGDTNNDGLVNFADLTEAFKSVPTPPSGINEPIIRRDVNGDRFINFGDLSSANKFNPGVKIPKPDGH